ncbi:MAG: thymidine phosphorylase [Aureliella sp.]
MHPLLPTAIIAKKRDQHELTTDEIAFMVRGITDGSIPDYQIASWAMAVLCRGMTTAETAALTDCMLDSGKRLSRATDRPRVDKHSTGGLGDKVSLILAPLLACFDLDVPMLSGRGLGITGGTLDKLEAYPGFRADLGEAEIDSQLEKIGCVITGTTQDIAPADRRLYLLRDATATVPSIGLITGSIMSKKLAASLDALVLDVKFGSGAFMQRYDEARELAESLVATGKRMGVKTTALLSDMNQPLGAMVGNACEVNEAVDCLRGTGPRAVRDLTVQLCARLLVELGLDSSLESAAQQLEAKLESGEPLERYVKMIESQGAQFSERLEIADASVVEADESGWVSAVDGQAVGHAIISLGGGRKKLGDQLNHRVGVEMLVAVGDSVERGQPLVRIFSDSEADRQCVSKELLSAVKIAAQPVEPLPLIRST